VQFVGCGSDNVLGHIYFVERLANHASQLLAGKVIKEKDTHPVCEIITLVSFFLRAAALSTVGHVSIPSSQDIRVMPPEQLRAAWLGQ
jgi:hypothetical protein